MAVNSYIPAKLTICNKMNIKEEEVSILIPTYNSEMFINRCLNSVLKTKAGEIIISDDNSNDNTIEIVKSFSDKRIKIFINNKRLGLWENHLQLLRLSSGKWIKFLQADDYLSPNALNEFCNNDDNNLSIVSAISVNENIVTKERKPVFNLSTKIRWSSNHYLERLKIVGNELGTPSNTLIKKENISLNKKNWKTNVSADLIMNVMAASKGDVVLLPPGPIIRGIHSYQDTNQQNLQLFIDRLINSVNILSNSDDKKIKEFANVFLCIEYIGILRMISGQILRGRFSSIKYLLNVFRIISKQNVSILLRNAKYLRKMFFWKYGKRETFNLDF